MDDGACSKTLFLGIFNLLCYVHWRVAETDYKTTLDIVEIYQERVILLQKLMI